MALRQPSDSDKKQLHKIKHSLLDLTYPYLTEPMLASSKFLGFQILIFVFGIYFAISYLVFNYYEKGSPLNLLILQNIMKHFVYVIELIVLNLIGVLIQMHFGFLFMRLSSQTKKRRYIVYTYCFMWAFIFLYGAIYVINSQEFYFTDRIFLIVTSWVWVAKSTSYCLDNLAIAEGSQQQMIAKINKKIDSLSFSDQLKLRLKFLLSPEIIFKKFMDDHDQTLKIHKIYLLIKIVVSIIFLLVNYILVSDIISPMLQSKVHQSMSYIELVFRLIPLTFYANVCLYYLIIDNIVLGVAQISQMKNRRFYEDWWNSETISQFLDKWVLIINSFSDTYLSSLTKRVRHSINLTIIFIQLICIFSDKFNIKILSFSVFCVLIVYFLGDNKKILNNYIVHILTITFTPCCIALQQKYHLFT